MMCVRYTPKVRRAIGVQKLTESDRLRRLGESQFFAYFDWRRGVVEAEGV